MYGYNYSDIQCIHYKSKSARGIIYYHYMYLFPTADPDHKPIQVGEFSEKIALLRANDDEGLEDEYSVSEREERREGGEREREKREREERERRGRESKTYYLFTPLMLSP